MRKSKSQPEKKVRVKVGEEKAKEENDSENVKETQNGQRQNES